MIMSLLQLSAQSGPLSKVNIQITPSPPTTHKTIYPSIEPSAARLPPKFVVFITGAGRECGKGIAIAYAKAGASGIIITSRTASELDEVAAEIKEISKEKEDGDIP